MKLFSVQFVTFLTLAFITADGIPLKTQGSETGRTVPVQQEKKDLGIGPVKHVTLGAIDTRMVSKGKDLFNNKCLLCHDLDQKKIGPPLRDITKIRTPEFIMNLLLNTAQMQQEDPIIKDLIATYKVPMVPPNLSKEDCRSILEYLRSVAK
jgi:cytochrome c551/c552